MAKPRNTDGAIEDLGVLLTAAYGLDTSWMDDGSCCGWGSNRPGHPTPWQVAPGKKYNGVSGAELVKYALIICSGCPSQYDCADYAVDGLMIAGTWAMPITQLRWLQKQSDAHDVIEMARVSGTPMQAVAVAVFTERQPEHVVCAHEANDSAR
jgi:hypothetical protein